MSKPVCIIMAGGKGERLWPVSRSTTPKHLLPITSEDPMVVETVKRILPMIAPQGVYIITNVSQKKEIEKLLPDVPPENIIGEPVGRDTAPCIAVASALTSIKYGDDAVMIILSADHHIKKEEEFRQVLSASIKRAAEEEVLITLGIKPDRPEVGYGYIEMGEETGEYLDHTIYKVNRFLEKPDLEKAKQFLNRGNYCWNSGMFVWRSRTILNAFQRHLPQIYQVVMSQGELFKNGEIDAALSDFYSQIEAISVDYGIMEKSDNVEVIPVDIDWDDVGSWLVLERLHEADECKNIIPGQDICMDSRNCIIAGEGPHVAALGVENLVVIKTDDAILITTKDHISEIKSLVKEMKESHKHLI